MTTPRPEDIRIAEQEGLAARLGIETSSATYIARTIALMEDNDPSIEVLASAYGLSMSDVREILTTFSEMEPADLAA